MKNLYLCVPIFSFVLLSCGGSNNNSALAPTAVNQAPSFTSAASVAVAENSSDTVYTAQANDPEGGAVTYALVSGADDNAVFDINLSSGELSFISAPDFENPTDTDTDNIYIVTLKPPMRKAQARP